MKNKLIIFVIFFPLFELIAFILTFLGQAIYSIRVLGNTMPFVDLFLNYILHPIQAVQECIVTKNPLIFCLPILFLVFLITVMSTKERKTSTIDGSGIYGTANWESIGNLTRRNIIGKSKFTRYSKKQFLDNFLESLNGQTKT